MNSSVEFLKTKYIFARRTYERFQVKLAKKLGWDTFYEIRPIDLTREDVAKLSREDCKKLQRLFDNQRSCFWEMHEAQARENNTLERHVATRKAYDFLDGFPRLDGALWLKEYGLTTFTLIEKLMENPNFIQEVVE